MLLVDGHVLNRRVAMLGMWANRVSGRDVRWSEGQRRTSVRRGSPERRSAGKVVKLLLRRARVLRDGSHANAPGSIMVIGLLSKIKSTSWGER